MSDDTHSGQSDSADGGMADDETADGDGTAGSGDVQDSIQKGRERLGQEADRAVESFDEGIVDLLSWVLDTETRARIYVYLRQNPNSTSEEIAEGTGLYPSTVREALAELTEEEKVSRGKRESEGAGNNPYEYEAIAPSELVGGIVQDVQRELNTVFNLDRHLGGEEVEADSEPINITVEEATDDEPTTGEVALSDDGGAEDDGTDDEE